MMAIFPFYKAATLLVIAALTALMLYLGDPGEIQWWAWFVPFWLWIAGPTATAYAIGRRDRAWPFAGPFLLFFVVSTLLFALIYYQAFFLSSSSTAALALVFIPLYAWVALGVTWAAAVALRWWMRRRG